MTARRRLLGELVGSRHSLQLAPMGAIVTPELAAAVIRAGGLGMVPGRTPDQVQSLTRQVRALSDGPLGVGILAEWADHELTNRAGECADVVDFFWGRPDPSLVAAAKGWGAVVGWQVGTVADAIAAAEAGCDFVSAQGVEAGGHLAGSVPLDRLLLEILGVVELPVLAAGGIGSAERVSELMAAGASGVRIGTRFLAAPEADVHPAYLEALMAASGSETCVTTAFGVGWPDAPHRVLCSAIGEAERLEAPLAGAHEEQPLPRFSSMPPRRATTGHIGAMALYAGTSVGDVTGPQSAQAIVEELMALAE